MGYFTVDASGTRVNDLSSSLTSFNTFPSYYSAHVLLSLSARRGILYVVLYRPLFEYESTEECRRRAARPPLQALRTTLPNTCSTEYLVYRRGQGERRENVSGMVLHRRGDVRERLTTESV